MKIVLATGIYPPDIGGPATYVYALASELSRSGHEVRVVTYGIKDFGLRTSDFGSWQVNVVPKSGGPLVRWLRYAKALRQVARDADVVEAFSSVSVGVPLMLARLKRPKKILRLGGDFFWERYTDHGGVLGLREWYERRSIVGLLARWLAHRILSAFDHIIFSTRFEEELYEKEYTLPAHCVIENALPEGNPVLHAKHAPFRLLFMGRFVGFKNLPALLEAMRTLPDVHMTFVGEGPMEPTLLSLAQQWLAHDRYGFLPSAAGEDTMRHFADSDLLVLPSLTELSPNVALEARACGLPVLLTQETGLSDQLTQGMVRKTLRTPADISAAICGVMDRYDVIAREAALSAPQRGWENVTKEHLLLFSSL